VNDMDGSRTWVPRPFAVGERVRVRFRGECPHCGDCEERDGRAAVVAECPAAANRVYGGPQEGGEELYRHVHFPGHDVSVRFDPPWLSRRWGSIKGACLAAVELERIEGSAA
jgi:hypothetical protein